MAAIIDLPLTPTSESSHTSSAVLADLEDMGVVFGSSLIYDIEAEILRYFIRTSVNVSNLWFTIYPDVTRSTALVNLENVEVAFGIPWLSCIKTEI